jgi:ABC-type lipoprotein release transport system permease subunit
MILITSYGLMEGMLDQMVRNATQLVTGEAQLHAPGYLSDRSLYKTLAGPEDTLAALRKQSIEAAPRAYGYGLVSQGTKSAGALFWGAEPEMEKETFDLAGHLSEGRYLGSEPRKELVMGKKLARSLNAKLGSEVVVLVQASDGSMGNELFTVTGIFKSAGEGIDRSGAVMHLDDFRELFVMPRGIHEIAVNTRERIPLEKLSDLLSSAAPEAEVKTWRQLLPIISDMLQLSGASMSLFGAIFFIAAGLGVMNTMLMATYERSHEFGLLKALGTSPWRIVRDVTIEAWLLACVSTVFGVISGVAASYALQEIGLDTSKFAGETTIAGVAFDPVWRASLNLMSVVQPVIIMWIVCVVASLYPAAMSARLDPVKSMHAV